MKTPKEKRAESHKRWRDKNPGYYKNWYANRPGYSKEKSHLSEQRNYESRKEYKRKYYQANKANIRTKTRKNKMKRQYGITVEDYDRLLQSQANSCAVCKTATSGVKSNAFYVDHCHKTGKVRGLLCSKCNSGIGMLGDTAAAVQSAADYLRKAEHEKS